MPGLGGASFTGATGAVGGGVRTFNRNSQWTGYEPVLLTNDAMAEDNFNELDKSGMRAALGVDLNDNWTL